LKISNIKAVAVKNLHQIKRDPRMIVLSIIAPIIVTALFGSAFGGDLTNLKVFIVDDDQNFSNIFANEIVSKIDEDPRLNLNLSTLDPTLARKTVDTNKSQAAIIFPYSFTYNVLMGIGSRVELYSSYFNLNTSNYIKTTLEKSLSDVMKRYYKQSLVAIDLIPINQSSIKPLPTIINVSIANSDLGWNPLHDKLSDAVYDILEEDDTVDLKIVKSVSKNEYKVKSGEIRAIIEFPESFTYNALISRTIKIDVNLDGGEPQASVAIIKALSSALSDTFEEEFGISVFNIHDSYYNNPDSDDEPVDSITYFTPAIIGFIVFFFAFLLTMLSFLRERKQGTMERILTSPVKRSEIILGFIFSYSLLSLLQATVVIIVTIFVFNAQIEFSWINLLQAYLIVYILLLAALGLGIFLSTLAKSEFQIIQFIPLVILPFMLLSGVWSPIETLPAWLRNVSSFVPLTYANNALRDILIRQQSLFDVIIDICILSIFAGVMILLGIISLNKKLK